MASANAATLVFLLDGGEGQTTFTQTVGGVTLSVTNPVPGTITALPDFYLVGAGPFMSGFDFQFDSDVRVTSYTVGEIVNGTGAYFDLTGPNGGSTNNSLASTGLVAINGTYLLRAGEIGTLASTFQESNAFAVLPSITVETLDAVPEPGTWTMLGGALAGLAALKYRRRPLA